MKRAGSVMLEAVLVLPVFVFFVFFLVQATFVWTARQMTIYAAYCAARAALVYNPEDYSQNDSGVAHKAACMVLSWISFSDKGSRPIRIPTNRASYDVPCSDDIDNQVRVAVSESSDGVPAVTATVDFKYPLVIPLGSIVFAFNPRPNGWDTGPEEGGLIKTGDAVEEDSRQYLYIRESYTLAKPYKTETFPLAADNDRQYLGIARRDGGNAAEPLPIDITLPIPKPYLPPDSLIDHIDPIEPPVLRIQPFPAEIQPLQMRDAQ